MRPLLASLVCAGALAAGCAHQPYSDWVTVRSEHFVLHTDTSSFTYQPVLRDVEALYAVLHFALFPNTDLSNVEIMLFHDPEAQRTAVKKAKPDFVMPAISERPMVLTDRPDFHHGRAYEVSRFSTLHEEQAAMHLCDRMLRLNMPHAPTWFRIGLEDYVETLEIDGDLARFGHRRERESVDLARGLIIPLGKLVDAPNSEFHGDWARSHRASAWGFIHFLMGEDHGAMRRRFDKMTASLIDADDGSPSSSRAAIAAAFPDVPFDVLEGRVRDYSFDLGRRGYFKPWTFNFDRPPQRDYPTTPADPERIRALLVDLKGRR